MHNNGAVNIYAQLFTPMSYLGTEVLKKLCAFSKTMYTMHNQLDINKTEKKTIKHTPTPL